MSRVCAAPRRRPRRGVAHGEGGVFKTSLTANIAGLSAVIDTPPVDTTLQVMAFGAARWLLVPTKARRLIDPRHPADRERVIDARTASHQVEGVEGNTCTGDIHQGSTPRANDLDWLDEPASVPKPQRRKR